MERPTTGTLRLPRPTMPRSQSDFDTVKVEVAQSPTGPPDPAAMDFSPDQFQRTYSDLDVWDVKKNRFPPLDPMVGFGKFRRSAKADSQYQLEQLRSHFHEIPSVVSHLGDFRIAEPDPAVWEQFRQETSRSNSFASSQTSASSEGLQDYTIDPSTGARVVRGFNPSNSSSAASSFRGGSCGPPRKNSTVSPASPSGESNSKSGHFPSRQSGLSLLNESKQLAAINEDLIPDNRATRRSRPLIFDEKDRDNAVSSDLEDEENSPPTVLTEGPRGKGSAEDFSENFKVMRRTSPARSLTQKQGLDFKVARSQIPKDGLGRSKTVIKRPMKLGLRRPNSRGNPASQKPAVALQNMHGPNKWPELVDPVIRATAYVSASYERDAESNENQPSQSLYISGKICACTQQKSKDEDTASVKSDSTSKTLIVSNTGRRPASPLATRHERSVTAIRNPSQPHQAQSCKETAEIEEMRKVARH